MRISINKKRTQRTITMNTQYINPLTLVKEGTNAFIESSQIYNIFNTTLFIP